MSPSTAAVQTIPDAGWHGFFNADARQLGADVVALIERDRELPGNNVDSERARMRCKIKFHESPLDGMWSRLAGRHLPISMKRRINGSSRFTWSEDACTGVHQAGFFSQRPVRTRSPLETAKSTTISSAAGASSNEAVTRS